jgi:tRNA-dihydrouridine synthase
MHDKTEKIEEILKIMRKSTKKPIFIKLRKSGETEKIIRIAEKYCDAICIHPRTKLAPSLFPS